MKKPYLKPEVVLVELAAMEAVANNSGIFSSEEGYDPDFDPWA